MGCMESTSHGAPAKLEDAPVVCRAVLALITSFK